MSPIRQLIYECIFKYMELNLVFLVSLLTKHALRTLVHFVNDKLVTPALTFEYADGECYGIYSSYSEGFISVMAIMMAAYGQVR